MTAARRCSFVFGPCVDGTQAGRRCAAPAGAGGRCELHRRILERAALVARSRRLTEAARVADLADKHGVIDG